MAAPAAAVHASEVTRPSSTRDASHPRTWFVLAQAAFSVLAAAVLAARAFRTAVGDGLAGGDPSVPGTLLAGSAALLAVAAAALAFRSPRAAALPLGLVLGLELVLLDRYVAPPRLVTAIPLVLALALALVPPGPAPAPPPGSRSTRTAQTVVTVTALLLMVPVGIVYLLTGLVAPAPDLFGAYALYAVLVGIAVLLARRRSWWVLAVPVASAGLWFAMMMAGETWLDWQA